jgi:hypothetical protein
VRAVTKVPYSDLRHQTVDEMRQFIGHPVTVIMDWEILDAEASGVLLMLSDDGEAQVRDDENMDHYVWPCLAVVPRKVHTG